MPLVGVIGGAAWACWELEACLPSLRGGLMPTSAAKTYACSVCVDGAVHGCLDAFEAFALEIARPADAVIGERQHYGGPAYCLSQIVRELRQRAQCGHQRI
jgi:hypothetical protein